MNVLVNGTTLNVKNAYAERDTSTGIITCNILVPYSEMEYADLKALFKANDEDIICNKDNGETETFSGFSNPKISDNDETEIYTVTMTAIEYDFQIGRNRQLEADKASLEGAVATKNAEITTLNNVVSERDNTISEKEVVITELEAAIAEKDIEIAELLTIAEEYADMLYEEALEEIESTESEVM